MDRDLARMVEHLNAGNRNLRDKLQKRITATRQEPQRSPKLGVKLGTNIRNLITSLTPSPSARIHSTT